MSAMIMLFKHPGSYEMHGSRYDYIVIDGEKEGAIEQAIKEGWALTTQEAFEKDKGSEPTEARKLTAADVKNVPSALQPDPLSSNNESEATKAKRAWNEKADKGIKG